MLIMTPLLATFGLLILLPVSSAQECNPASVTKCGTDCHCLDSVNCGTGTCVGQCQPLWTGSTCQTAIPDPDTSYFPALIAGVAVGGSFVVFSVVSMVIFAVTRQMRQRAASANALNNVNEPANLPEAPSSVYENQPISVRGDGSTVANLYDHLDDETPASVYTAVNDPQNTDDSDGYILPVV